MLRPGGGSRSTKSKEDIINIRSGSPNGTEDGNVLDRLCESLLQWDVMSVLRERLLPGQQQENNTSATREELNTKLPDAYSDYEEYFSAWKPLVVEEIRESLLSSFPPQRFTTTTASNNNNSSNGSNGNNSNGGRPSRGNTPLPVNYGRISCKVPRLSAMKGDERLLVTVEASFSGDADGSMWHAPSQMEAIIIGIAPWNVYETIHTTDNYLTTNATAAANINNSGSGTAAVKKLNKEKFCSSFGIVGLLVSTGHSMIGNYSVRVHKVLVLKADWEKLLRKLHATKVEATRATTSTAAVTEEDLEEGYMEDNENETAAAEVAGVVAATSERNDVYLNPLYSVQAAESKSKNSSNGVSTSTTASPSTDNCNNSSSNSSGDSVSTATSDAANTATVITTAATAAGAETTGSQQKKLHQHPVKVSVKGDSCTYQLHYFTIGSIRCGWREFQALHDLRHSSMLADVLATSRPVLLPPTPPNEPSSPWAITTTSTTATAAAINAAIADAASAINATGGVATTAIAPAVASGRASSKVKAVLFDFPEERGKTAMTADNAAAVVRKSQLGAHAKAQQLLAEQQAKVDQLISTLRLPGVTEKFMLHLRSQYNASQLHAIHSAVTGRGFCLVQGPPGTGKTSTIIGILNAIHIREYNRYYDKVVSTMLGVDGQRCRQQPYEHAWLRLITELSGLKPRLLVVAPSNTAVDNIISRIMADGFKDGTASKYNPKILRVGVCRNESIRPVSLDALAEQQTQGSHDPSSLDSTIRTLSSEINATIAELAFVQGLLINMQIAFQRSAPQPVGIELRVCADKADKKAGLPYWVDHQRQTISSEPPPAGVFADRIADLHNATGSGAAVDMRSLAMTSFKTLESLPEYHLHTHSLTQLVGALEGLFLRRNLLQSYMSNVVRGSGLGSSSSSGSHHPHGASLKEYLERSVLDNAQLVFTTLNSSGHSSMESTHFNITLVDEAAQSVEPSVLIALRRGCQQCVLVGDQQQLPATVLSQQLRCLGYDRSLFQRLIETGHPFTMLDTQYRMTPAIAAFPAKKFYGGILRDGENVKRPSNLPAFLAADASHTNADYFLKRNFSMQGKNRLPVLPSFMFFDLLNSSDNATTAAATAGRESTSKSNIAEAKFCTNLMSFLMSESNRFRCLSVGSIGVISPYSEQIEELKRAFRSFDPFRKDLYLESLQRNQSSNNKQFHFQKRPTNRLLIDDIEFNTVDGFQGKEKDIIIFSTVRANDSGAIGFLSDARRMNVALTRARKGMFIVGSAPTLRNNPNWKQLLQHAASTGAYRPIANFDSDIVEAIINPQTAVSERLCDSSSSNVTAGALAVDDLTAAATDETQQQFIPSVGRFSFLQNRDSRRMLSSTTSSVTAPATTSSTTAAINSAADSLLGKRGIGELELLVAAVQRLDKRIKFADSTVGGLEDGELDDDQPNP